MDHRRAHRRYRNRRRHRLQRASQITGAGANAGSNLTAARNLFTAEDHVNLTRGKHRPRSRRLGAAHSEQRPPGAGPVRAGIFRNLTSFLQGNVATFTAVPTSTPLGWRSLEAAEYIQDTIQVRHNLEISIGFRAEHSNGMDEAHGRAANYLFNANGVIETQPNVGVQFSPSTTRSFFPSLAPAWPGARSATAKPWCTPVSACSTRSWTPLATGWTRTPPSTPPSRLKNISAANLHITPGAALPSGALVSPSGIQPNAQIPAVESYTLKIERQITPSLAVGAGFVGSHGYHQILSLDANLPAATVCPAAPCPAGLAAGTLYNPTGAPLANPALANTTTWWSNGNSSYNALQLDVTRHFHSGLQFRAVYTFAKSLDDGTAWNSSVGANAPGFVMYPANPRIDWGLSTYNVRQSAVLNGTYALPVAKNAHGLVRALAAGWTAGGIATLQSGLPFTPQLGYNPANDGDSRNPVRPSWNPAFSGPVILGGPNKYFNPAAFAVPPPGTYGNVGRDTLIGPGIATLDLSAMKNAALSEKLRLQFRAEFFNLLNRANFGTPNTVVYTSATSGISPTAGVITSTSTTSRQIQFGLKLLW